MALDAMLETASVEPFSAAMGDEELGDLEENTSGGRSPADRGCPEASGSRPDDRRLRPEQ